MGVPVLGEAADCTGLRLSASGVDHFIRKPPDMFTSL